MTLSWEEFKKKKNQEFGVKDVAVSKPLQPSVSKHVKLQSKQPIKLYTIHKRSLPVGLDKIVVFGITKTEAEWLVGSVLKSRCYENGPDDSKTLIYFDILPLNATPKEHSVYHNPSMTAIDENIH